MRAAILALFLVACAPPARRTYQDGPPSRAAPAFVHPGYAPAGAGLPEYMPGQPEPLPRSPHGRILPETPETRRGPGIWAGDEPKQDVRYLPLLNVALSLPPKPTIPELEMIVHCKLTLEAAGGHELNPLLRLPDDERACIAARLFSHCADGLTHKADRLKRAGEAFDLGAETARKRVATIARRMREALCIEAVSKDADDAAVTIMKRWSNTHETP